MSWSKSSVSAWMECAMVKIVHFSMAGISAWLEFQHGWNVSYTKLLVSECLDYFMVKIVCFSIAEMCHGPVSAWMDRVTVIHVSFSMDRMSHCANCPAAACLDYVIVKIVCFSIARMCHGQNCQFQHVWNMSWSLLSISARLECVMVKIVSFSRT
jgi:hypothetical protein